MRLSNPAQALLWKCWRRSHWQLGGIILVPLTLLILLLGLTVIAPDISTRNAVSRSFVCA